MFINIIIILHENREHVPVVSTKYCHLAATPGAAYPPRLGLAYLGQYLCHILSKVYSSLLIDIITLINSSPPGRYFADDTLICIFVNENNVLWLKIHWSLWLKV